MEKNIIEFSADMYANILYFISIHTLYFFFIIFNLL